MCGEIRAWLGCICGVWCELLLAVSLLWRSFARQLYNATDQEMLQRVKRHDPSIIQPIGSSAVAEPREWHAWNFLWKNWCGFLETEALWP